MITPGLEVTAQALGALLVLLMLAYPREFHLGGLLLVLPTWVREVSSHLRRPWPMSGDWDEVRAAASRKGERRRIRRFLAARARMRKYVRTWESKPKFAEAQKQHAGRRLAAVRGRAGR